VHPRVHKQPLQNCQKLKESMLLSDHQILVLCLCPV